MPPAPNHLGIPLKAESFPGHHVGCRYWDFSSADTLGAPCGIGLGKDWAPGLNKGACNSVHKTTKDWKPCSCGLYCFAYDKTVGKTHYFDLPTATPNSGAGNGVVGGIAYWIPRTENPIPGQTIVSAKYAAVAALMYPAHASKAQRTTIDGIAARYEVEIVKPNHLGEAVDEWVASRLPDFYDPPARPLHSLLGEAEPYQPREGWDYVPRVRQPLVYG